LPSVSVTKPVPIEESPEDLDSVREKIKTGQAFLKVVEYPWGVEFDVISAGGRQ
jgi:hypothetical protein